MKEPTARDRFRLSFILSSGRVAVLYQHDHVAVVPSDSVSFLTADPDQVSKWKNLRLIMSYNYIILFFLFFYFLATVVLTLSHRRVFSDRHKHEMR